MELTSCRNCVRYCCRRIAATSVVVAAAAAVTAVVDIAAVALEEIGRLTASVLSYH